MPELAKTIEQQRHEQLIKVLAEISSHLKQIAQAVQVMTKRPG